ncbi:MAG: ABC transporter, partial [Opitutaceae bacterium]
ADTDWLLDDFSVRKLNLFGTSAAEPLNDNLAFAANALDYLSGSDDLLSIRGKGSAIRRFTVVQRMNVEASRKYDDELTALEAQLTSVQSKISDLQGKQTQGNRLVATPEVAKAIQDFRDQQVRLRAQRREIRHALTHGINVLKYDLLAFNLLLSPLLICGFGLWYSRARRRA